MNEFLLKYRQECVCNFNVELCVRTHLYFIFLEQFWRKVQVQNNNKDSLLLESFVETNRRARVINQTHKSWNNFSRLSREKETTSSKIQFVFHLFQELLQPTLSISSFSVRSKRLSIGAWCSFRSATLAGKHSITLNVITRFSRGEKRGEIKVSR